VSLRLAARCQGRGEPLVLLHGLFGSSANWHSIAARLSSGFTALSVDLHNHGASPHVQGMNYAAMADDVVHLLDAHGLCDAHVLGHSIGGKVAMTLALRWPLRVRRLVVVDISPVAYPDRFTPFIDAVLRLDLATVATRADADRQLALDIASAPVRALLLQNLVRQRGGWAWRIDWRAISANLPALLGFAPERRGSHCAVPTLFVQGADSDYVLPEHRPLIDAMFPQASFRTIAGAGHWVHVDRPAELSEVVSGWLG
jgi:esterase